MTISHNTLLNENGQTSAIGLFCDFAEIGNVTIDNNLLAGGGYTIYGGGSSQANCTGASHDVHVTNNKFLKIYYPTSGQFGPVTGVLSDPGYNMDQQYLFR